MTEQDNIGASKLRAFAERLTRLLDEQTALGEDIKAVKAEAASDGYNSKALTDAIKHLAMTPEKKQKVEAQQMEFALYLDVLSGVNE